MSSLLSTKAIALPLVSVITPAFNSERYIEMTINSVLNQDYPNIEYIIIDGASTDSTFHIIKSFGARISYCESSEDTGMYAAINKGLRKAKGDILCYLNSDDCFRPNTVSEVVKAFSESSCELSLVYGDLELVNRFGQIIRRHYYRKFNKLSFISCDHSLIGQPSAFWTKAIVEKVGLFDESFKMAGDFEFFARISAIAPETILHRSSVVTRFRIHTESLSSNHRQISASEVKLIKRKYSYSIKEASCTSIAVATISRLKYRLRNVLEVIVVAWLHSWEK